MSRKKAVRQQDHSILRNYWVSRLFFKDPVSVRKPNLPGPGGENPIEKWTIECP